MCYETEVPVEHQVRGFDGDTVIYTTTTNEPAEGFIAWAVRKLYIFFFFFSFFL
jgi:hypothetical protein